MILQYFFLLIIDSWNYAHDRESWRIAACYRSILRNCRRQKEWQEFWLDLRLDRLMFLFKTWSCVQGWARLASNSSPSFLIHPYSGITGMCNPAQLCFTFFFLPQQLIQYACTNTCVSNFLFYFHMPVRLEKLSKYLEGRNNEIHVKPLLKIYRATVKSTSCSSRGPGHVR